MWLSKEKARAEARISAKVAAARDKAWVEWLKSQNITPPQTPPPTSKK